MRKSVYRACWDYIVSSKKYIFLAIDLFLISAIIGFAFSSQLGFLDTTIKDLLDKTQDLQGLALIWFIFQNNALSSLVGLFFGAFFAIVPIFNAIINGAIVGYVISIATKELGPTVIWRLLPHGVFELPAIFISLGLGLRLGIGFFSRYFKFYSKNLRMKRKALFSFSAISMGLLAFFLSIRDIMFVPSRAYDFVYLLLFFGGFLCVLLGLVLFCLVFFVSDRKLRAIQINSFLDELTKSFRVFVYVIIPLLVIAAIIEGLLITLA
ncbi:MAG: stage II sporulation protein M [Nanoarchaeota archaeon]